MRQARILVLRGGSIGDFIFTLPALSALRNRWPDAIIELIGYQHIAQLALAGKLVDRVISIDKADVARLFSLAPKLPEEQIAFIRSFDIIISYLFDPHGTVKENMLNAGAKQVIYGSPLITSCHAVDQLMKPLKELAIYPEQTEYPKLRIPVDNIEENKKVFAIHPGSGSPRKNWPLDRYIALADLISSDLRMKPVFTAGEADDVILNALRQSNSAVEIIANRQLADLGAFLASCAGFVGNDTGITHLAAAVGIPVVALFGPTDPRIWGPRGPNVQIIQTSNPTTDGLPDITIEQVFTAIRLSASPDQPPAWNRRACIGMEQPAKPADAKDLRSSA